jgi:ferrous iron transport protein A
MSIVVDKGNSDSVPPINAVRGVPLGLARRGFCGRIHAIHVGDGAHGLSAIELERRLLELGFVEGAEVEVLHEGPLGGDPIAVRVNDNTIALRRREAMAILVI